MIYKDGPQIRELSNYEKVLAGSLLLNETYFPFFHKKKMNFDLNKLPSSLKFNIAQGVLFSRRATLQDMEEGIS
jgi:hypothetical protein